MISLLIGILIIVVVGAICFWAIERFAPDKKSCGRLFFDEPVTRIGNDFPSSSEIKENLA